jgi:hypothetical protein
MSPQDHERSQLDRRLHDVKLRLLEILGVIQDASTATLIQIHELDRLRAELLKDLQPKA